MPMPTFRKFSVVFIRELLAFLKWFYKPLTIALEALGD